MVPVAAGGSKTCLVRSCEKMTTKGSNEASIGNLEHLSDIHLVLGNESNDAQLFLGTQKAAQDARRLREHNISRIVCIGTPAFHQESSRSFLYLALQTLDLPSENLLVHLDKCVSFIEEGMQQGQGILVNCVYAQSRSPSIVVAYLMKRRGLALDEALGLVRAAQPTVHVNPGFEAQLVLYQDLGCELTLTSGEKTRDLLIAQATYRWFLFAKQINGGRGISSDQENFHTVWKANMAEKRDDVLQESSGTTQGRITSRRYQCKACRAPLFSTDEIINHSHPVVLIENNSTYEAFRKHGDGSSWIAVRDAATSACNGGTTAATKAGKLHSIYTPQGRGKESAGGRRPASAVPLGESRCTSVFTGVLPWIGIVDADGYVTRRASSGKITCPGRNGRQCGSKLGSWKFEGIACSCGRKVKPAVQFVLSRVEPV